MTLRDIKKIKGFSLIEISVVLLIVAIFIAAIASGKLLIDKSNDIRLEQALQSQLESQLYYSAKSFEVGVSDLVAACGGNPSDNAIADFLYSPERALCCDAANNESLCCDNDAACIYCNDDGTGNTSLPNCIND